MSRERKRTDFDMSIKRDMVDIHCHCLAGVDDGPEDISGSLDLCRALSDQGIGTVVASVHQLGRYEGKNAPQLIREKVSQLTEQLKARNIPLTVLPGGDVRVDERLAQLVYANKVLTVGDCSRYILIEMPHEVLVDITSLIAQLNAIRIVPIITHPERHSGLMNDRKLLEKWLSNYKCYLQVTAASLTGSFGPMIEKWAWDLVSAGRAAVIASDAHGLTFRPPMMQQAYNLVKKIMGRPAADLMFIENPSRVINAKELIPMTAAAQKERP